MERSFGLFIKYVQIIVFEEGVQKVQASIRRILIIMLFELIMAVINYLVDTVASDWRHCCRVGLMSNQLILCSVLRLQMRKLRSEEEVMSLGYTCCRVQIRIQVFWLLVKGSWST
jgi:hypothetical protein